MNLKKIILISLTSVIGIMALGLAYIVLLVDPNEYKPEIVNRVKLESGRDLLISGDISWRFLPNIGFTIGKTTIENPGNFPEQPLIQFKSAQIDLAFWPLLNKKIEVGLISIQGLNVNLHTRKDGVSNLSSPASTSPKVSNTKEKTESKNTFNNLVLEGIQITDASIVIENLQQESYQKISSINFKMGEFKLDNPVLIAFSADLNNAEVKANINSEGRIQIDKNLQLFTINELTTRLIAKGESLPNQQIDITSEISGYFDTTNNKANIDNISLSLMGIELNGKLSADLSAKPSINYEVAVSDIDIDAIFSDSDASNQTEAKQQAINLDWMKDLDIKGMVKINSIKAHALRLSNIELPLKLTNAKLKSSPIKAQLYNGNLLADIHLNSQNTVPLFSINSTLNNVQILPLVKDLLDKEIISGDVNTSFNLKGKGLDQASLRKNTKGTGQFAFTDGAIYGVNVAQLVRKSYAKIKGIAIEKSDEPEQTDFASFTGSFNLANGIASNSDLKLLSPLLRISGTGKANIINEMVDYKLKTAIVETLECQGGQPIADLKNLTIPLKIKGPMNDPKITLDMQDLFETKLKDKLKNKLKGLFGN